MTESLGRDGGEENLINKLHPRLCESDTGQTRIVFMSCVVDLGVRGKQPVAHCNNKTRTE